MKLFETTGTIFEGKEEGVAALGQSLLAVTHAMKQYRVHPSDIQQALHEIGETIRIVIMTTAIRTYDESNDIEDFKKASYMLEKEHWNGEEANRARLENILLEVHAHKQQLN